MFIGDHLKLAVYFVFRFVTRNNKKKVIHNKWSNKSKYKNLLNHADGKFLQYIVQTFSTIL